MRLRPAISAALLIAVISAPTVIAFSRAPRFVIETPLTFMSLGMEIYALVFPFVVTLVGVGRISREVSHGYIASVRARTPIGPYLHRLALGAAARSSSAAFASVFLLALIAFAGPPGFDADSGQGMNITSRAEMLEWASEQETFSQLIAVNPWLYVCVISCWSALWAAVFTSAGSLLLFLRPRLIVALSVPIALYWLENIVTANTGVPEFGSMGSAFPQSLIQFPILTAVVPMAVWCLALLLGWLVLVRNRYQRPHLL